MLAALPLHQHDLVFQLIHYQIGLPGTLMRLSHCPEPHHWAIRQWVTDNEDATLVCWVLSLKIVTTTVASFLLCHMTPNVRILRYFLPSECRLLLLGRIASSDSGPLVPVHTEWRSRCLCLCLCWSCSSVLRKLLNRSRCRLEEADSGGPKESYIRWRSRFPKEGAIFVAQRYASAAYIFIVCPSACLSVIPLQVCVLPRRLNLGSSKQRRPAGNYTFLMPKISANSNGVNPTGG